MDIYRDMKEIISQKNSSGIVWKSTKKPWFISVGYFNSLAIYWIVPLCLFLLWWVASNEQWMPAQILPTPKDTWHSFVEIASQDLWSQLAISLERFGLGLLSGVIGGVFLGVLLGYSRVAEQYLSATFYALVIIPTLAWLPLLMIWLGIENSLKIFIIFKATMVPIALHTQAGVRDIQPKLKEMAAILQFNRLTLLTKLVLPATLPYFFTGLRLAVAAGWTSLIAVELLASSEGIGYLMVTGRQLFQLDIVFVTIFVIASVGIIFDFILHRIERKFVFWPHAALSAHTFHKKNRTDVFKSWVLPLSLVVLWAVSSWFNLISSQILPAPWKVLGALWSGIQDFSLTTAMYYSLYRAILGLIIGGLIGASVGIVVGLFKPIENLLAPTLNTLRLIAIFAWIPLLTAWFGLEDLSKIVFISIATFFPMFIATWKGMSSIPMQLVEVSSTLRMTLLQRLTLLILPSIAPSMFAGFRLALLYSWMASFGAEYLMGSGIGIGSYMMAAQQNFEMERVIAATVLVAGLGAILAWLGKITENYATSWRKN
ncbi:ABC transporter permease [Acinetobacter nosocomialis]|uniref:ABC transporter permease n=1 Tax=Acinetobacter nosocomialis TaxID=106654 RepID=UPI00336C2B16